MGIAKVISIIHLSIFVVVNFLGSSNADRLAIDHSTLDYLKAEQDLWQKIENDVSGDKSHLFAFVHNNHKRFLANSTTFGGASLADKPIYYKLPSVQNFSEILDQVESLRSDVVYSLQPDGVTLMDVVHKFEHKIGIDALKYYGKIIHEISQPDFWKDGTNYLDNCEKKRNDTIIEAPYRRIYDYYKDMRAALLQTFIYTQLSCMLEAIKSKEPGKKIDRPKLSLQTNNDFRERIKSSHKLVADLLETASRDVWNCSPNKNYRRRCKEKCTRFDGLRNFLQGYIDNEVNLNKDDSCQKTCSDYKKTKHLNCGARTICHQAKSAKHRQKLTCDGDIRDCSDIDMSGEFDIYYDVSDKNRRYNSILYDGGRSCGTGSDMDRLPLESWWRWFVKCSSCFCLCDTRNNSDRYFSLHDVVSDIEQNKVVAGIRLLKENGVVQMQIREEVLKPRAHLERLTLTELWKGSKHQFSQDERRSVDGVDYFTLTYENRSINLDDVMVPAGKVVTGVRFSNRNAHVLLEVRATDFDYTTGFLTNLKNSVWLSNENGGKHEIKIKKRSAPYEKCNIEKLYIPQSLQVDSYIRFGPTDFKSDLGQTTIPQIDTDGVYSDDSVALSGIGLSYENDKEWSTGGAIVPKIIIYKLSIGESIFD